MDRVQMELLFIIEADGFVFSCAENVMPTKLFLSVSLTLCFSTFLAVLDQQYTLSIQSRIEQDKMALINAAKDGRIDDVKALIDNGADVDAKDTVSRGGIVEMVLHADQGLGLMLFRVLARQISIESHDTRLFRA
jgi:hypothetical protein